jgi:hypothetical protein
MIDSRTRPTSPQVRRLQLERRANEFVLWATSNASAHFQNWDISVSSVHVRRARSGPCARHFRSFVSLMLFAIEFPMTAGSASGSAQARAARR